MFAHSKVVPSTISAVTRRSSFIRLPNGTQRQTKLDTTPVGSYISSMSAANGASNEKKSYHKKATGLALRTVEAHADEHELKLFGSCFW